MKYNIGETFYNKHIGERMEFEILTSNGPESLANLIKNRLLEGWELVGSMSVGGAGIGGSMAFVYAQQMVRYPDRDKKNNGVNLKGYIKE